MKIKLPVFHCLRCGHQWSPKKPEEPLRCAFCKSPYWKKPPQAGESAQTSRHADACVGCRETHNK